jgi:radical SAM-linked protein
MEATPLHRARILYTRGLELRYVGHLDMQLVWERTIRRSRLQVAYSQGFSPRPRFHMAAALPLGFTSRFELIDVWFEEPFDIAAISAAIQKASQPGLTIQSISEIDLRVPALQTQVHAAEYCAVFKELPNSEALAQSVAAFLAAPSLPRVWRKKEYDLRPLVYQLEFSNANTLSMHLSAREGATARPEEVLSALGIDFTTTRIERTALLLAE